jgi:phosphoglycerate dehydrogenase-like enzyme
VAGLQPLKIAVLDDYQSVALSIADWSALHKRASVTAFSDHLADPDAVVARLQPFEIVCVMRERTPMTRTIIERLPNLRLIASTGPGNASIALAAAAERGLLWTPGIWIVAHLNNNVIPMSTQ